MSMVDAYKAMWKNYAKFSGRARRSEYWWVILAQTLISTAFSLINMVAGDSALGLWPMWLSLSMVWQR